MDDGSSQWLAQAKKDLGTAKYLHNGKRHEESAFFCQQSVEKSLKSLVLSRDHELIKTHDLVFLAKRVSLPSEFEQTCKELTLIYVHVRYPDAVVNIKDLNKKSKRYLISAEGVLKWVRAQLSAKA
ncbi:MAG TPA: HEPN domain-containing protein [Candidatus Nanoarchaeia archaeon]|nr:HEPN domain-containing protein [Candidatus Nanoarchaeia archaeon]